MTEPTTVNVGLIIPNTGDLPGTWSSAALNPDFAALDGFLGGIQTISVSNANITLTAPSGSITPSGGPTQSQNSLLIFTGVLTGNVQVTLPLPGLMAVGNYTTGNFVLTFAAVTPTQVVAVEQGSLQRIVNNGTNVQIVGLPSVGSYLDVCDATIPAWITACTIPPYLNCDGSTFNATTYPYLNTKLGGNVLPDLRGVARYTLNQGTNRITAGISGLDGNTRFSIKTNQANALAVANLPPYTPSGSVTVASTESDIVVSGGVPFFGGVQAGAGGGINFNSPPPTPKQILSTGTLSISPQGGTNTPFPVIGTGTVSGITLIRAA